MKNFTVFPLLTKLIKLIIDLWDLKWPPGGDKVQVTTVRAIRKNWRAAAGAEVLEKDEL